MNDLQPASPGRRYRSAVLAVALGITTPVYAGPIGFDIFYQFGFTDAGLAATGCDPADPAGAFCIPSSETPTTPSSMRPTGPSSSPRAARR